MIYTLEESNSILAMTKADLVNYIARKHGTERIVVQRTIESFMEAVSESMERGENVYLRGFGSFVVKERAAKVARNISKSEPIVIPAHCIPSFKPSRVLAERVRKGNRVKE